MKRQKPKQDPAETARFAALETALKIKIDEAASIADPAEKLLRYKALKEEAKGTYAKDKVRPTKEESISSAGGTGAFAGRFIGYMVGGTTALPLGISVLGPVIGLFAFIPAVALVVGSIIAGGIIGRKIGKKRGQIKFEKNRSPEEKHATRMSQMTRGINTSIRRLENFYKKKENMPILAQSKHFKDVMDAFSGIAAACNGQAAMAEKQAALLGRPSIAATQTARPVAG
jgi:hypothetical protein